MNDAKIEELRGSTDPEYARDPPRIIEGSSNRAGYQRSFDTLLIADDSPFRERRFHVRSARSVLRDLDRDQISDSEKGTTSCRAPQDANDVSI